MKELGYFIEEGKLKVGMPNPAEAESLKEQAIGRIKDVKMLPLNKGNCSFRFESAYESLREIIQPFMARNGYKPYSHDVVVSFAFYEKLMSESESYEFDRIRQIRNDINYRAKKVTLEETKAIIDFADQIISRLDRFQI